MKTHTTRARIAAALAACALTGGLATACTPPAPKADDTTTPTTEATAEATPTETDTPAPAPEGDDAQPADAAASPGKDLETWWLAQYDATQWSDISDKYGGWEGHVLDMGGTDDTVVVVTNLDGDNPDGKEMAEGIVKSVQNQAEINGAEMPASVRDNIKYVQVFDAAGNIIANGSVEFE